jgi:ADP-ribosylglycohydrolase
MDTILTMLLAGWCADAIGAHLEFGNTRYTEERVRDAMRFRGHSTTMVGKGQVTDDTELEISLLHALLDENDKRRYPRDLVASNYLDWFHSDPFDIGTTTRNAMFGAHDADGMEANTRTHNQGSLSNGALMRSAALSAFYWNLTPAELMAIAKQDAQLTHSNTIVHEINGLYVVALVFLIQSAVLNTRPDGDAILRWMCETARETETKEWIQYGLNLSSLYDYDAITSQGCVKHAFIMVVYFLNNIDRYSYETAIMETLCCGGDTDTNAKIVGSMMGAYYTNCVPASIMNTVMEFDCTKQFNTYPRPSKYSVLYTIRHLCINKGKFIIPEYVPSTHV